MQPAPGSTRIAGAPAQHPPLTFAQPLTSVVNNQQQHTTAPGSTRSAGAPAQHQPPAPPPCSVACARLARWPPLPARWQGGHTNQPKATGVIRSAYWVLRPHSTQLLALATSHCLREGGWRTACPRPSTLSGQAAATTINDQAYPERKYTQGASSSQPAAGGWPGQTSNPVSPAPTHLSRQRLALQIARFKQVVVWSQAAAAAHKHWEGPGPRRPAVAACRIRGRAGGCCRCGGCSQRFHGRHGWLAGCSRVAKRAAWLRRGS